MGDTARSVLLLAVIGALAAYALLSPPTVPAGRSFELRSGESVRIRGSQLHLRASRVGRLWTLDGRETGFIELRVSTWQQTQFVSIEMGSPADLFDYRILLVSVDLADTGSATLRIEHNARLQTG